MPYKFSLIRFVPDPARGEFVNIGAIATDRDEEDWAVRWISNYTRAKVLDSEGYLAAAKAFTATLDERVSDSERLVPDAEAPSLRWLRGLAVDMNNVIQLSDPAPVVADSAEAALDLVFERLVVDPARTTYRFRKKHQAQAATRRAYRAHHVPEAAVDRQTHVVSRAYDFQFDFAVRNGRAVQIVQCWSFELPNQAELTEQVKAWAWMVHELRENGGHMRAGANVDVPADVDVAAVYIPPADGASPAFAEAQDAFGELGVTAASYEDADTVGAQAARLLAVPH